MTEREFLENLDATLRSGQASETASLIAKRLRELKKPTKDGGVTTQDSGGNGPPPPRPKPPENPGDLG